MQVSVQVDASVVRGLRQPAESTRESQELRTKAEQLGLLLRPTHPDTNDPSLVEFLIVDVPDRETGERVAAELSSCRGVKSAYVKPADELP